ncbi:MAG: MBL fold metallo-hydrolase [Tissierellia bacterium]|nr:MBL fold metallo-hydrolase [Tissierellia bacterium]
MKMKFCSLSSGSSGNCVYMETENTRVLIDAGFSGKKVEELLKNIDVDPKTLDGILVTHEHTDHIKGVGILSRRYNLPIMANYGTWMGMDKKIGKIKDENILIFKNDYDFEFRDLEIHPISTYHDSECSCGYIVGNSNKKITVMTDTGYVSQNMKDKIKGSDILYVEANHDVDMLKNGIYPYHLKQRVLSTKGHLSNIDSAMMLGEVLKANEEKVILAHLSQENNTPKMAFETIKFYLEKLGLDTEKEIDLSVAPRHMASKIITLD